MGRDVSNFLLAASAVIIVLYVGKQLSGAPSAAPPPVVKGWFG